MNNIVGNILQDLLSKEGSPTKKDFAKMLGVAEKTLYNILNGETQMVLGQVVKAGNILNFDIVKHYLERESSYQGSSANNRTDFKDEKQQDVRYGLPQNNMPKLTYEFYIPEKAYSNIKTFQDDILVLAEKHGMIIN